MKLPHILSAISAVAFGFIGGKILDHNIENYTLLFLLMGIIALITSRITFKIPSQKLDPRTHRQPLAKYLADLER